MKSCVDCMNEWKKKNWQNATITTSSHRSHSTFILNLAFGCLLFEHFQFYRMFFISECNRVQHKNKIVCRVSSEIWSLILIKWRVQTLQQTSAVSVDFVWSGCAIEAVQSKKRLNRGFIQAKFIYEIKIKAIDTYALKMYSFVCEKSTWYDGNKDDHRYT